MSIENIACHSRIKCDHIFKSQNQDQLIIIISLCLVFSALSLSLHARVCVLSHMQKKIENPKMIFKFGGNGVQVPLYCPSFSAVCGCQCF